MWVGGCVTALATWASPPRRRGPHRQGDDAGVYTNRWKWPLGAILGRLCTLLGCCAVVDRREDAIVYTDRRKRPISAILGHLCTLLRRESRYESRRELPASGGASASATMVCRRRLLAGPSRLVGKTGSERVAPLLGWRLRRGVNPHELLKSLRLRRVKGPVSTDKTHPYAADCGT